MPLRYTVADGALFSTDEQGNWPNKIVDLTGIDSELIRRMLLGLNYGDALALHLASAISKLPTWTHHDDLLEAMKDKNLLPKEISLREF